MFVQLVRWPSAIGLVAACCVFGSSMISNSLVLISLLWLQLWSLPTTCEHLWLADCVLPDEADEHIFGSPGGLPDLKTLVLKRSRHYAVNVPP